MSRETQKIKLQSIDDLFNDAMKETDPEYLSAKGDIQNIPLDKLVEFSNHPFEVNDDEKMDELVDSILAEGVVTPIIVRKIYGDLYEIISGHRRTYASRKAGKEYIPAIVKRLNDDEATVLMVDSNIQRTNIKVSERARSLKMKYDCLKKQGRRNDLTLDHNGPKLASIKLGEDEGLSSTQVKRYIRLNNLIPALLFMIDENKLDFTPAVDLSFMKDYEQEWVYKVLIETHKKINVAKAVILREKSEQNNLTEEDVIEIIVGVKRSSRKVTFSEKELNEYFNVYLTEAQIKDIIIELIKNWKEGIDNG